MMQKEKNLWIADNPTSLPDFIIGGAMKSATTTLHKMLAQHPHVFIPKDEIHFFDIDNILQHGDFNFYDRATKKWIIPSMEDNPQAMWQWYNDKFKEAGDRIKGEDSTIYLASPIAAQRIALQPKPIKLIFLLRQPSERAFSNYVHLLKTGRAIYSFEDTIRYQPHDVLERSLYKKQLQHYYDRFPARQIHIVLFEEFITDPKSVLDGICDFIGIDKTLFSDDVTTIHENVSGAPSSIRLQLLRNRWIRQRAGYKYLQSLPQKVSYQKSWTDKIVNQLHAIFNPYSKNKKLRMHPSTKSFLDQFFKKELQGLDELTGRSILSGWFEK